MNCESDWILEGRARVLEGGFSGAAFVGGTTGVSELTDAMLIVVMANNFAAECCWVEVPVKNKLCGERVDRGTAIR